jgi:hypothetical protein
MKTGQIPYRMQRIMAQVANSTAFAPRNQRRQRGNQRRQCGDSARQGAGFHASGMRHASMPGLGQAVGPTYGNRRRRRYPSGDMPTLGQAACACPALAQAACACRLWPRRQTTRVARDKNF